MNRLGPTSPPPLTVEFTEAEAESLAIILANVPEPSPSTTDFLAILETYLEELS